MVIRAVGGTFGEHAHLIQRQPALPQPGHTARELLTPRGDTPVLTATNAEIDRAPVNPANPA